MNRLSLESSPQWFRETQTIRKRSGPWTSIGELRYRLLQLTVVCQLVTVLMTWVLWEDRMSPPNLPVFFPISVWFGPIVVFSLAWIWLEPARGVWIHLLVLGLACLGDQTRLQPQFFAIWMLMFACISDNGLRITRWFLVSLWLWAGIHKFVSPDWFGMNSWVLVSMTGLDPEQLFLVFAVFVAISEVSLGVMAIFRPDLSTFLVLPMHLGICFFLLTINWNHSVLPWNVATAVVGSWVFYKIWKLGLKPNRIENLAAAIFLISPALFYVGLLDHGFSNVLYSGNLPRATMATADGSFEIKGWGAIRVPFPNERRLLVQYFETSGKPGDKLHLFDPRHFRRDAFFEISPAQGLREVDRTTFFSTETSAIVGVSVDDRNSVYQLGRAGCLLGKTSKDGVVVMVRFPPESFDVKLLRFLPGLQNLEELRLCGCPIGDNDLTEITSLPKLSLLDLESTNVSSAKIAELKREKDWKVSGNPKLLSKR